MVRSTLAKVLALGLTMAPTLAAEELGSHPLCEASAALPVACASGLCLLVADNEDDNDLYLFQTEVAGGLRAHRQQRIRLGNQAEVGDIESLAGLGDGQVLVMGSHSRNTRCEPRPKRRRFVTGTLRDAGLAPAGAPVQTDDLSCATLFGANLAGRPDLARACESIAAAEQRSDQALTEYQARRQRNDADAEAWARQACGRAGGFNVEGVAAIPSSVGRELWVGLRSPLTGRGEAMLLRMAGPDRLRFDGAAFLDLGGRGVRDLALGGGWLWGVAGPLEDSPEPFQLWRVALRDLRPGVSLKPEQVGELPTSSEGLALFGPVALLVVDGDRGEAENVCLAPAGQRALALPGL